MHFNDLPAEIISIRVRAKDGSLSKLVEQPVLSITANLERPGVFELSLMESVVFAMPVSDPDIRRLGNELADGRAMLAQLVNSAKDGSMDLQVAFFSGEPLEMGSVDVGVDEYVLSGLNRLSGLKLAGTRAYSFLEQNCCYRHGGQSFFFMSAGPAIDGILKQDTTPDTSGGAGEALGDDSEGEEKNSAPHVPASRKNSLCILGDGLRFVATATPLQSGQSIYIAKSLTNKVQRSDRATRLAKGELNFVDWTKAGKIQLMTKAQLSALTKEEGSYLRKWDEFGDLEGEILLKRAREIGVIQYSGMNPNRDGTVTVRIVQSSDSALNTLSKNGVEALQVVDVVPNYIEDSDLTFSGFASSVETQLEDGGNFQQNEPQQSVTIVEFDEETKDLRLNTEQLNNSGMLIFSLAGEIAQIKRRMAARRAILEGRSANPQLGVLIEENGKVLPRRPAHKVEPLNAFVKNKVFPKHPPTPMQERAIKVALNTPDIALIQGPPGTGKTTVIAAILERLNQMADKRGAGIRGQVLLTGFQHDAVENMIERLSLNGIPVPKYGKRSGGSEDDYNKFEKDLEVWCANIAKYIRSKHPEIVEVQREVEIKNLCLQYLKMPTNELAINLANKVVSLGTSVLGEALLVSAVKVSKKLNEQRKLNEENDGLANVVRRLRRQPESFADDGPERAADALDELSSILDGSERDLLERASLWDPVDGVPPFLGELLELKKKLLHELTAAPAFRVEKHNDQIIQLAKRAVTQVRQSGLSSKDLKAAALAELLSELENNPYGMIDAISDFSFAFSATCQQSVNRQMRIQKGIIGENGDQQLEYEYVIVDEAARVSPRDLMVPIAQGKRIILVGDHRQLPHIIDDEVARQMEAGEEGMDESDWLKKSMFEYLFSERLKALTRGDRICRSVTLDTQYRMHPILGDFVSRNFYERFNASERFRSGRQAEEFAHNLPGTDNLPALWLDVGFSKGKQKTSGTSWTRPAEATVIARKLTEWMGSDEGKELSFGVISFYKAQADLIRQQLKGISDDDKRLRIGTVDSFQGMEFDVVFLSVVRTVSPNREFQTEGLERQARSMYGHLCLYNRLNVAMSRQEKLLVVVGDANSVRNDIAKEFVPGMLDFLHLCETEGGLV